MAFPQDSLSAVVQRELMEDLNYLNMAEIKAFCKKHSIPYSIWIQTEDHDRVRTRDEDRKGVVLNRIRRYLKTGIVLDATCFPASVVCFDEPPKRIKASDRLFYGQYDPKSERMIALLRQLTGGKFQHGAIARILAREYWSKGIAPSYREYAAAWLMAKEQHKRPNPEWAFLSDRAEGKGTTKWKELRERKARKLLRVLGRLERQNTSIAPEQQKKKESSRAGSRG
jgi:hypothetical protein